jgi:competence protein ComEC
VIRPVLERGAAPAVPAAAFLAAGLLAGAWSENGALLSGALAVCGAAGLAFGRSVPARRIAFAALWLGAGFANGAARIAAPERRLRETLRTLEDSPLRVDVVEGRLADFWTGRPPRARTVLRAERRLRGGEWSELPAEIVLYVSGDRAVESVAGCGDRVRVTGRLESEDVPASDREVSRPWTRLRMSCKSALMLERVGAGWRSLLAWPNRWLFGGLQAAERDAADPRFDRDVRGPLAALLLGRTSELDAGMVARYRRGGLYHLLVVSGLHVVLAVSLVLAVLAAMRVEGKSRDAILLAAVWLFVLCAGANPPAVRAGIVVSILVATRLLERPIGALQALGLSAILLFGVSPRELFSVGVVLTFAAVGGMALFARPLRERLPERPRWLWPGIAAALAAESATAPILLWRFNVVAAGAWLTTPLTVPLCGALIAVGGVLVLLYAAGVPAGPLPGLFAAGSRVLEICADRAAGAAFLRPTPPLWAVLAVEGLLLACALGPRRLRPIGLGLAAAAFAALALRRGPAGPERGLSVEALDVGQGDAILLRWRRTALLVDGGGTFDITAADFGRTRLVPKLLDRGVTRLDAVLLSHPHPDHALGLFSVLDDLPVGELWTSTGQDENDFLVHLGAAAARRGVPVRRLEDGDRLSLGGARLSVLHSGGPLRKTDAINNQSVVLRVERDGRSALLTGDAGAPVERDLAASGALEPVDLLKVGHHGSRTSTSSELLEALEPRVAVVSCGRRNRFGHPSRETLARVEAAGVPLLRTDRRSDCRVDLGPDATRLWWRGLDR